MGTYPRVFIYIPCEIKQEKGAFRMTQNNQIEIQATDGSGTFNAFVAKP